MVDGEAVGGGQPLEYHVDHFVCKTGVFPVTYV